MSLLLVRHAYAGKRKHWKGNDLTRPLTDYGRRQAEQWVAVLEDRPIDLIMSSPARRCMETVLPLALWHGVSLMVSDALSTDATLEEAQIAIGAFDDLDVVACTHREVLEQILPAAKADGAKLKGGMKWPKGGAWDLKLKDGHIASGIRIPSPNGAKPT